MIDGMYTVQEIETALAGLAPDIRAKFESATSQFTYAYIAIKDDAFWATATDNGKSLWGTIAPNALFLSCGELKKNFKVGRLPKDKAIYDCADGSKIMFALRLVDPISTVANPLPSKESDNAIIDRIFTKLETDSVMLPEISTFASNLQITEFNATGWSIPDNILEQVKAHFDEVLKDATEQAYAGIVVQLPELYAKVRDTYSWLKGLDTTEAYDVPEAYSNLSSSDYINMLKQYVIIAMINCISVAKLELSDLELSYLRLYKDAVAKQVTQVESTIAQPVQEIITEASANATSNDKVVLESSIQAEVQDSAIASEGTEAKHGTTNDTLYQLDHSATFTDSTVAQDPTVTVSQPVQVEETTIQEPIIAKVPAQAVVDSVVQPTIAIAPDETVTASNVAISPEFVTQAVDAVAISAPVTPIENVITVEHKEAVDSIANTQPATAGVVNEAVKPEAMPIDQLLSAAAQSTPVKATVEPVKLSEPAKSITLPDLPTVSISDLGLRSTATPSPISKATEAKIGVVPSNTNPAGTIMQPTNPAPAVQSVKLSPTDMDKIKDMPRVSLGSLGLNAITIPEQPVQQPTDSKPIEQPVQQPIAEVKPDIPAVQPTVNVTVGQPVADAQVKPTLESDLIMSAGVKVATANIKVDPITHRVSVTGGPVSGAVSAEDMAKLTEAAQENPNRWGAQSLADSKILPKANQEHSVLNSDVTPVKISSLSANGTPITNETMSPELAARSANPDMADINKLIDGLEAFVNKSNTGDIQ